MEENVIQINVRQRMADHTGGAKAIVADNTEYIIQFVFDGEWQAYPTKTVLFVRDDGFCYPPVIMDEGKDSCKIPRINGTGHIRIGVTAGDIITTTPAEIRVLGSVLEASAQVLDKPADNVWACVVEQLRLLSTVKLSLPTDENGSADNGTAGQYAKSDGQGGVTWGDGPAGESGSGGLWYPTVTDGVISWTKSVSETAPEPADIRGPQGTNGKSAYEYAQEGGYTGTEAEYVAKLAEEMPDTLPNPNALTFTGAVSATYDGSEPLTVEIPSGSDGSTGHDITITELASGTIPSGTEAVITHTGITFGQLNDYKRVAIVINNTSAITGSAWSIIHNEDLTSWKRIAITDQRGYVVLLKVVDHVWNIWFRTKTNESWGFSSSAYFPFLTNNTGYVVGTIMLNFASTQDDEICIYNASTTSADASWVIQGMNF